jgi:hypothetical protein
MKLDPTADVCPFDEDGNRYGNLHDFYETTEEVFAAYPAAAGLIVKSRRAKIGKIVRRPDEIEIHLTMMNWGGR